MYKTEVEVYSDATNAAVMRHPGRHFPGVLVQGDTLSNMCRSIDDACAAARGRIDADAYLDLNELRNHLRELLGHYKIVLQEHNIRLPFTE
jgi:hypothetical protein